LDFPKFLNPGLDRASFSAFAFAEDDGVIGGKTCVGCFTGLINLVVLVVSVSFAAAEFIAFIELGDGRLVAPPANFVALVAVGLAAFVELDIDLETLSVIGLVNLVALLVVDFVTIVNVVLVALVDLAVVAFRALAVGAWTELAAVKEAAVAAAAATAAVFADGREVDLCAFDKTRSLRLDVTKS
jgi:hypothetical protein